MLLHRTAAKLSQTELADMLSKTLRTVQKYESGEIEPSIATINSIAGALNVSPAELIGYQKQELRLDTLSDVLFVLNELNKKAGLRFDIDVRRPRTMTSGLVLSASTETMQPHPTTLIFACSWNDTLLDAADGKPRL